MLKSSEYTNVITAGHFADHVRTILHCSFNWKGVYHGDVLGIFTTDPSDKERNELKFSYQY